MYVHWKRTPFADAFVVLDAETGERIDLPIVWADDVESEIEYLIKDEKDSPSVRDDSIVRERAKRPIRIAFRPDLPECIGWEICRLYGYRIEGYHL